MADETSPSSQEVEWSLEYARRLYDRVLAWYESAERKAQLILTLDGLFLSFLTSSLLSKPADLRPVVERFGAETWVFLGFSSRVGGERRVDDDAPGGEVDQGDEGLGAVEAEAAVADQAGLRVEPLESGV